MPSGKVWVTSKLQVTRSPWTLGFDDVSVSVSVVPPVGDQVEGDVDATGIRRHGGGVLIDRVLVECVDLRRLGRSPSRTDLPGDRHVAKFEQNAPISDAPTSLILEIRGDWDLSGQTQGGKATNIDYDAEYEVEGDEVVVIHSEGSNGRRSSSRRQAMAPAGALLAIWLLHLGAERIPRLTERALRLP